jgi:hypothetical protein
LDGIEREHVNKKAGNLDVYLYEEESSEVPRLIATESDATFRSAKACREVPLTTSETFRGSQIAQPGGAVNFLIILTPSYLA